MTSVASVKLNQAMNELWIWEDRGGADRRSEREQADQTRPSPSKRIETHLGHSSSIDLSRREIAKVKSDREYDTFKRERA